MNLFIFEEDAVELASRNDEESHRLTYAPAISTHHLRTLHAGLQLTLASLRHEF